MPSFVYPTAAEMFEIQADLSARAKKDRIGLTLFPVKPRNTYNVRWAQKDNMFGLMQMRGLDGQPPKVQRQGFETYIYEPGIYGEHTDITEREWMTRANILNLNDRIDITEEVLSAQELLTNRKYDRMEYNAWTLLATGKITVPMPGPNGESLYIDQYSLQTYAAAFPWSNAAQSTPIIDLQNMQQLQVGHGTRFDAAATFYLNQVQANRLINNANTADLFGKKNNFGATLNNLPNINNYFQSQNLPAIVVYDEGFQNAPLVGPITNATTQFTKFILNGSGILVGKRKDGGAIGEFQQTIQSMVAGLTGPGEYAFVKDSFAGVNTAVNVPGTIEVHQGFNGGLALWYPSAIISATI